MRSRYGASENVEVAEKELHEKAKQLQLQASVRTFLQSSLFKSHHFNYDSTRKMIVQTLWGRCVILSPFFDLTLHISVSAIPLHVRYKQGAILLPFQDCTLFGLMCEEQSTRTDQVNIFFVIFFNSCNRNITVCLRFRDIRIAVNFAAEDIFWWWHLDGRYECLSFTINFNTESWNFLNEMILNDPFWYKKYKEFTFLPYCFFLWILIVSRVYF